MSQDSPGKLSHVAADGTARMVDVGGKPETARMARATGHITMTPATLEAIVGNTMAKGDVLAVARVAGIMAAKRTAELIPLCHPLPLTDVSIEFVTDSSIPGVRVEATARTVAKAMDKSMVINDIALAEKTGGAGGPYARP